MVTIVQCSCGAEYRRTEEKFLVPHTGDAVCTVCGAALESWSENSHVPSYELIERPAGKPNVNPALKNPVRWPASWCRHLLLFCLKIHPFVTKRRCPALTR